MKISLICCEDGLMNIGFRKIAAQIKKLNPGTTVYYIACDNSRSVKTVILGRYGDYPSVQENIMRKMAEPIAGADIVAFSSMTGYAPLTRNLIKHVRAVNPRAYILWGGIHPIIVPEDAIRDADAVCTGEGEFAFETFFEAFRNGRDFTKTKNFWFRMKRTDGSEEIVKNDFLPLMTGEEMTSLPLLHYGKEEWFYKVGKGYVSLDRSLYTQFNGLGYNTVWSIGCPFKCTFCGNTKFIENDRNYRRMRHPSAQYIIDEINQARAIHPHISTVAFHDDSFMALPSETIEEFAAEYKRQVGIPFAVYGVIPNYVREDKFKILLEAGLNRIRMGIQNGSENILKFYERPTPPARALEAARTINKFKSYMIPPAYDIIVDNPVETKEDVVTNLKFLKGLPRPYTLNVFSLRVIPNTHLEIQMKELKISIDEISSNYMGVVPTMANCLVFLLATFPVPNWLFKLLLRKSEAVRSKQKHRPGFLAICRTLYLIRRGFDHLKFMDFTVVGGSRSCYLLWKIGLVQFWRRYVIPKYAADQSDKNHAGTCGGERLGSQPSHTGF